MRSSSCETPVGARTSLRTRINGIDVLRLCRTNYGGRYWVEKYKRSSNSSDRANMEKNGNLCTSTFTTDMHCIRITNQE